MTGSSGPWPTRLRLSLGHPANSDDVAGETRPGGCLESDPVEIRVDLIGILRVPLPSPMRPEGSGGWMREHWSDMQRIQGTGAGWP